MHLKLHWCQLGLAHMAVPIAKQACGGNIGGGIGATVFSCQQMLGSTLKQTCLFSGDLLLDGEMKWGG